MQSLRVGISPVLESLRHVGVCPYSLHYYTLFTAVKTAVSRFLPNRDKIAGLPRSRILPCKLINLLTIYSW